MRFTIFVFVALVCAVLARNTATLEQDVMHTLGLLEQNLNINTLDIVSSITVSVDGSNSNTGWIQLLVTPGGIVNNLQASIVVREGDTRTYTLQPCSWDAQRYIGFCWAMPDTVAQMDTPMTVVANLRDGGSVSGTFQYTAGASYSAAINPQEPFNPYTPGAPNNPNPPPPTPGTPTPPQVPNGVVKPGTPSAAVKKFIGIIKRWSEPSGGPSAYIGRPGPNHDDTDWDLLQSNKILMDDILTRMGIVDLKAKAALFTIFGIETERMYLPDGMCEGDRTKTGKSANYSPANMNMDLIVHKVKYPGITKYNIGKLNQRSNLQLAINVAIASINKLGMGGFLNFHRAGQTGYSTPKKCDPCAKMTEFRQGVYNAVKVYTAHPSVFREGNKVISVITYISDGDLWCCKKK
jgi:hypothetical protein